MWSNETACAIPSGCLCFFPAVLLAFGELFYLCPLLPTPQTAHAHTHIHIKTRPPVTPLVFTYDVASSCYCMFSTLSKRAYEGVCMCMCACWCHMSLSPDTASYQLQKAKKQSQETNSHPLYSAVSTHAIYTSIQ